MPHLYQKLGIHFMYPDNWRLDEEEALAGNDSVSVYSPEGAFWSIAVHPRQIDQQELVDDVLRVMREEYEQLDSEPLNEKIAGYDVVGYEMNFYCLDLTNTAWVRSIRTPQATFVVFCQAEDRELVSIAHVFDAMTRSLFDELR